MVNGVFVCRVNNMFDRRMQITQETRAVYLRFEVVDDNEAVR